MPGELLRKFSAKSHHVITMLAGNHGNRLRDEGYCACQPGNRYLVFEVALILFELIKCNPNIH